MKPGSQRQVKLPAGWLLHVPRGPHTLEEMCRTSDELLVATVMVQLSIAVKKIKKKCDDRDVPH
jgi:hypothetical protein